MSHAAYPSIVISASQRDTADWDHGRLAQVRVSFQYCDAVYRAGGLPLVVGSWTGEGPEFGEGRGWAQSVPRRLEPLMDRAEAMMSLADGLMLTGGGDVTLKDEDGRDFIREMDRDRDFWEAALLKAALDRRKPILGICRGLQLINLFLGGTLWDDIPTEFPDPLVHQQRTSRDKTSHEVILEASCKLAEICGVTKFMVNSGHHQAAKKVAPGLAATGRSPDGLIEVLEYPSLPWVVAVQWHPEALAARDAIAQALFAAFIKACA